MSDKKKSVAVLFIISIVIIYSCNKNDIGTAPSAPVNPPNPSSKASNNSPVGIGDTLKLFAVTVPGATYTWSGPAFTTAGGNSSLKNVQNPVILNFNNATMDGEYTLTTTTGSITTVAYHTYVTDMELTLSSDSILGDLNGDLPVPPATANNFISGNTAFIIASNVLSNLNQPLNTYYIWKGPGLKKTIVAPYQSNLYMQYQSISGITGAMAGTYTVYDSIPVSTTPYYSQAHKSKTVLLKIYVRPAASVLKGNGLSVGSFATVGGSLTLTFTPPSGASPNDNQYSWTGPLNWTSTAKSPTISNISRQNMGTYYFQTTNDSTQVKSVLASIYINVNYSATGCGATKSIFYNGVNYSVVTIGNQCWTASDVADNIEWNNATPAGKAPGQGVCPVGWHMPTDSMFYSLASSSSVNYNGNTLKALGQGVVAGAGTNTTGFSAELNVLKLYPKTGIFWSISDYGGSAKAGYMQLNDSNSTIIINNTLKVAIDTVNYNTPKYSVRCLKD